MYLPVRHSPISTGLHNETSSFILALLLGCSKPKSIICKTGEEKMKKLYFVFAVLLIASMMLTACGGGKAASSAFKVGQVTDLGGIDDKSFNATAYAGVTKAVAGC
jgi:hypothetical protein